MLGEFVKVFLLYCPGIITNAGVEGAVQLKFLDFLAVPLDGGLKFRGKPLLGKNKTLRGLLAGIITGAFWGYFVTDPFLGMLQGIAAIVGDAIGSFIKRQLNFAPGENFPILDQLDYVPTLVIVTAFFRPVDLKSVCILIIIAFIFWGVTKYTWNGLVLKKIKRNKTTLYR